MIQHSWEKYVRLLWCQKPSARYPCGKITEQRSRPDLSEIEGVKWQCSKNYVHSVAKINKVFNENARWHCRVDSFYKSVILTEICLQEKSCIKKIIVLKSICIFFCEDEKKILNFKITEKNCRVKMNICFSFSKFWPIA